MFGIENKLNKECMFTHDDLDGVGCALLFQLHCKLNKKLCGWTFCSLDKWDDGPVELMKIKDSNVWICGLPLPPTEVLEDLRERNNTIIYCDHHQIEIPEDAREHIDTLIHNTSKSATMLLLENLLVEDPKLLLPYIPQARREIPFPEKYFHMINSRDCWLQDEYRHSADYLYNAWSVMGSREITHALLFQQPDDIERLFWLGGQVEAKKLRYIEQVKLKGVNHFWGKKGRKYASCFAEQYISDVGNALVADGADIVFIFNIINSTRVNVHLRSNDKVDCSAIAKKGGGGGHKRAAGFEMTFEWPCQDIFAATEELIESLRLEAEAQR